MQRENAVKVEDEKLRKGGEEGVKEELRNENTNHQLLWDVKLHPA